MGVLQEQPRSATVRAVGEVTAEAIPGDEFLRRVSGDSATALPPTAA
jgi:CRP-like cAMP-binding protein